MLLQDHKLRVARLLRGERKIDDLHHLFSDLRMHKPPRKSVQEIGHFAAHRHERDVGISLERANDIQTSAKLWHQQNNGKTPDAKHLLEAGSANLRIIPESRVMERLGFSHQTAKQTFNRAVRKYEKRNPLKKREIEVLQMFGLSMMWQFAFNSDQLWSEFVDIVIEEGALEEADRIRFEPVSTFVSLYALSIMHGARLKLADGATDWLRLAQSEEGGFLRIKADIPAVYFPKPISVNVPMFETGLMKNEHCHSDLLGIVDEPIPSEIKNNRLVPLK